MIHNISKPKISPAFTTDDIRKIRDWNYERLKDASIIERINDTQLRALHVQHEAKHISLGKGEILIHE